MVFMFFSVFVYFFEKELIYACNACTVSNGAQKKGHRKKEHGKKGTGKMGTGKKATSEKLGKKGHKGKKIVFICRLLLLLFNQHLDYSMYIFCGCLLFNLLNI